MWKKPAGYFVGCAVRVERAVVGEHVDAQRADLPVAVGGDLAAHQVVAREAGRHQVLDRSSIHFTGLPVRIEPTIAQT